MSTRQILSRVGTPTVPRRRLGQTEVYIGTVVQYRPWVTRRGKRVRSKRAITAQVWAESNLPYSVWLADGRRFYLAATRDLDVLSQAGSAQLALVA